MPFLKVLVAVEAPLWRNLLKSSFTAWGCRVIEAANTHSACATLLAGNIDLCFLDWRSPTIDGQEICRCALSLDLNAAPYLVLIADQCSPAQLRAAYVVGANDLLPRPFEIEDLKARFAKVASRALQIEGAHKEGSRLDPVERYRQDLARFAKVS